MKGRLLLLLMLFLFLSAFAQIDKKYNAIRPGDEIIKQQVEYKDPGRSGENVVWNFGQLKSVNPEYKLSYHVAQLIDENIYIMGRDTFNAKDIEEGALIVGIEHSTMYYYQIKDNALLSLGHENSMVLMHHKDPILSLNYPFHYKQKVTKTFESEGLYSSIEPITTKGDIAIESDAYGKMILPSGDTLNHVMRIKTIQNIHQADSVRLKEENPLHMQVETYRWYTKGYRYPIFETIRSFNFQGTDKQESFNTAFFYPPQEHYYLSDDAENIAVIDSLWNEEHKGNTTDPANPNNQMQQAKNFAYNFYPNPVVSDLNIEYFLEERASVNISLYDMQGKQIKKIAYQASVENGLYSESVDCQSLPQGNYILRLQIGEEIVNEKIIKK